MFAFVKVRKTKSNLSLAKEGGEEAFDEYQYEDEQNNEDENKEDEGNERYYNEDQYEANELDNSLKKYGRNCRKARHAISETKTDRKNGKKTKLKVRKRENPKLKKKNLKHFKLLINWHQLRKTGKCEVLAPSTST